MNKDLKMKTAFTLAEGATHVGISHNTRRVGFTLAEVLITLGIIGIVSAMTIPTLIKNYQEKITTTKLKKVYAEIIQVVKLSEIDNGAHMSWDFPTNSSISTSLLFIEKYYLPYFKGATLHDNRFITNEQIPVCGGIKLQNGTVLSFFPTATYLWLFVDLNGKGWPNKVGRDIFVFEISKNEVTGGCGEVILYGEKLRCERASETYLRNVNQYACNKNNTHLYKNFTCGTLIKRNDWKIPEDYPW